MTEREEPKQDETVEEKFKRLGVELTPSTGKTTVVFLGPKGMAALKRRLDEQP